MSKHKKKPILNIIRDADISVSEPDKTDEVNPIDLRVPGMQTEKTEIGVATVNSKKALYLKLRLKGGV